LIIKGVSIGAVLSLMGDRSGIKRHQNLKPGSSAEQQKDTVFCNAGKLERMK